MVMMVSVTTTGHPVHQTVVEETGVEHIVVITIVVITVIVMSGICRRADQKQAWKQKSQQFDFSHGTSEGVHQHGADIVGAYDVLIAGKY